METPRALMPGRESRTGLGLLILVWVLLPCLAACNAATSASLTPTSTPSPTVPSPTPSSPPGPTRTSTPAPTRTATSTRTPTPSPSAIPTVQACWAQGGRIERDRLSTELSPWPWEYRVYLPPCYDQQATRRYPVLYLIHGSTYTDEQWDRLGADETADRLIAAGEIPPFIIVMPRDRTWLEPAQDPFGQALTEHLIPWIDANYRTLPQREFRAIGGLSRGASWAVHLGLSRWELFSAIGAHSLPVFWSDTGKIRTWLEEIPPQSLPRLYLDIGDHDYLIESALWFESVLDELDIPHEWYLFPGRHEEAYWQAHLEGYLRWYTRPW